MTWQAWIRNNCRVTLFQKSLETDHHHHHKEPREQQKMGDNTTPTDSTTTNGHGNIYNTYGTAADENEHVVDYDGPAAPETDASGYRIREEPYGTKRKLKVVLMGAGASSLNFFKKAEEEMQNLEIVCYEKNRDIGGTWLENR